MRKFLLTLSFFALICLQANQAQVSAYSFTTSNSTYNSISGGTLLRDGSLAMDSWVSTAITIPSFTFNGVAYTTAFANSNGFITLGATAPSSYTTSGVSSPGGSGISICPFGSDLDRANSNATTEMRWETVGNEIVFQWKQVKRWNVTENFDFQIRLNTVSGVVSFVYQLNSGPGASTSYPEVGIRTSATDYNNRMVASGSEDWSTSLPGIANTSTCRFTSTAPQKNFTSGLTYSWTPPTCFSPGNILFSNLSSTSVDITWTAPATGTPSSYLWKVVLSGAGSGGTAVSSGTETHPDVIANVAGLTPSTGYDFFVRTFCGGTDYSGWAGPFAFTTLCPDVALFTENFDAATTLPSCWAKVGTGGSVYTQTTSNFSAPNCMYIYSGTSTSVGVLSMPPLSNAGANTHVLKFKARANYTAGAVLEIGYLTNPNDPASFILLDSKTLTLTYADYEVYPGTAPGTNKVLAFRAGYLPAYSLLIDNVSWEPKPTCPGVNALSANITATSADLNWNEIGTATSWKVQWGQTGFTLGNGTIVTTTVKPYHLAALTPNTSYTFYVQSYCGGVDTSIWAGPYTFTTPCLQGNVPYFEGFESITANNQLPGCMSATSLGTKNLTYIASNTYNRIPKSGTNYASFAWAPGGNWFFFAPVQLTGGVSYDASVYYITDGASGFDALNMAYGTAQNASAMTQIATVANPTNTTYQLLTTTFTPSTTGVYYLGIQANGTSTTPWYLTIDDISITHTPTCPGVTPASFTASNAATTSADLNWTEPGTATHWQIEYGVTGFTQGQGNHVITSTNPYHLSGLTPATLYQAYIRSICSSGDTSSWKGPISFATTCITMTTDFTEGFESPSAPPICWTMWYANATPASGNLMIHSTADSYTGNQSFRFSSYSSGAPYEQFLETPFLNYTTNKELTFWYKSSSIYGTEVFAVGTTADGTNWTWGINDSDATNTEWKQYIAVIPAATKYVAIQYKSDYQYYLYIDDFSIHAIPTCPGVTTASFAASNPTINSVNLTWSEPGTATKWQIEYGFNGFTLGTGSHAIVNTVPPYTLTGLQSSKLYQVYIRSICSPGDTSAWKGPISFATLCGTFSIPFTENFNGIANGAIPTCWYSNFSNWGVYNSNNAGSIAPEMRLNWSPSVTDTIILATPLINATNATSLYLRFKHSIDYYSLGNPYTLGVIVSKDGGLSWDSLWAVIPTADVTGQYVNINLSTYIGQSINVAWVFTGNTYDINYWYIDDVLIDDIPPCSVPSALQAINIMPTSADLTWLSGEEVQWKIEWDTTNFVIGTGNYIVTSDNPFTLTGLSPETTYDFYVKAYCAFDSTNWSSVFSFTTLPTCPAPDTLGASNITTVSANLSWVPVLSDTLWQIQWGLSSFVLGTGNLVVTTANPYLLGGLTQSTNYKFYVRALCDITSGDTSTWAGPYAFTTLAPCNVPTNLHVSNLGTTFADLSWTAGGTEQGWEIEWDTANFVQGTGNLVTTINNPYTLTGLTSFTQYDFYVRAVCDSAYTSTWAGPETFTTLIVGIDKIQDLSAINIYPNPSNGTFNILILGTSDNLTVTVANIQGQIVYSEQLSGIKYGTISVLDLKSLAKGMYHISLNDGKTIINKKLVIN